MSKTASLKNQLLTFEQKKALMLKDLEVELLEAKVSSDSKMRDWWIPTLERKIKELQ